MLTLEAQRHGDAAVIYLTGAASMDHRDMLREPVLELVTNGAHLIVLDFAQVTYLNSLAIGDLISAYTGATNAGAKLVLTTLPPNIANLFQITNLDSIFEIYPTVDVGLQRAVE